MSMIESGKQVVIAIVTSAVIGLGGQLLTLGSQRDLLNETRDATRVLSQAVTDLRIQVAEDRGKYVTREELRAELERGNRNGS